MSIEKWNLFEYFEKVSFSGMTAEDITTAIHDIYYQAEKQYADLDVRMKKNYVIDNNIMEACRVIDTSLNDLWILAADETRSETEREASITEIDTIGKEYEQRILTVLRLTDADATLVPTRKWR